MPSICEVGPVHMCRDYTREEQYVWRSFFTGTYDKALDSDYWN